MVANTKSSLIKLENVSIGYSKKNFLFENLNFVIPEKAFINIQGSNGSGKTSLAKLFLGLLSPINGKVFLNYKNPAYVPQHSNFDKQFPLNLIDIVEQGLKYKFSIFNLINEGNKFFSKKGNSKSEGCKFFSKFILSLKAKFLPKKGNLKSEGNKFLSKFILSLKAKFLPKKGNLKSEGNKFLSKFILGLKAKFLENIFSNKNFNNKQNKEFVDNIIFKLGLNVKSNLTIDKASGGQLQRALIARALVFNPDFLVLDEPFNHLDQKSRVVVWEFLQKIHKENNITICIIDHNLFDFKNTSDVKKNIKEKLNSIYTHLINIDDKISFVKLR